MEKREVSKEEGEEFVEKEDLIFFEVCSNDNDNIKKMFYNSIVEMDIFEGKISNNDKGKLAEELYIENEVKNNDVKNNINNEFFNDNRSNNSKIKKKYNEKDCSIY